MHPINFNYQEREKYLVAMNEFISIMKKINFDIFLHGGTLLGAVREKDFIKTDDDIDLFWLSKQNNIADILKEFNTIIKPHLESNQYFVKEINWTLEGFPRKMLLQYHITKDNILLDIFGAWIDENNKFHVCPCTGNPLDKEDVFPFKKIKLSNNNYLTINNPEKLIEQFYGKNWKIPTNYRPRPNWDMFSKKILKIIDAYGWAYHFIAREQKKYSYHQIDSMKLEDLDRIYTNKNQWDYDILYYSSPGMAVNIIKKEIDYLKNHKPNYVKIIGAHAGGIGLQKSGVVLKYDFADLIVGISYRDIEKLKNLYPDFPVIFLPESADTEFFIPNYSKKEGFTVGWAGRLLAPDKRCHLLDKLDYPISIQADSGKDFLIDNRDRVPMLNFYQSLNTYICISEHECMPKVVLEAMSCGLPVIATDCDSIRLLLDKEWIVPNSNDKIVLEEVNKKLHILEENPKLREKIGKRNREHIEKYFSWKVNQPRWDEVINALYNNDFKTIENIHNYYKNIFDEIWEKNKLTEKKLKILKVIDAYGWAYHFIYQEQIRYSKYQIDCIKIEDLIVDDSIKDYDIVYYSSPGMWTSLSDKQINQIRMKYPYIKIIGAYAGETQLTYSDCDIVASISLNHMKVLKEIYKNKPVIYLPEAVDDIYFKPNKFKNSCIFGWAGRKDPLKRIPLLDTLKYNVVKKSDHDKKYFIKERTVENMLDFYKNINVFLLPSKTECMPRVILESMACGLPVIATDVGSLKLILEDEWLIFDTENDINVKNEMNKRMELFYKYPELRKKVGERNRKFIEEHLAWRVIQPLWDSVFEQIEKGNYKECVDITNKFLSDLNTSEISDLGREAINKSIIKELPEKNKTEEIKQEPIIIPPAPKEVHTFNKPNYASFFRSLEFYKIKYWLIKNSCLECVILKELKTSPLEIETIDIMTKAKVVQLTEEFNITADIAIGRRNTKKFNIYETNTYVPMPVVEYLYYTFGKENLINQYGNDWRK